MKQAQIPSSVQRDLLLVREASGDMLCLYAPISPTRRSYRAVLEVAPINLALKAEDEQEAIIERFGALIRSLSYPLQVLVRNQRLNLSPSIEHLLAPPGGGRHSAPTWFALASSLADLLRHIAAERTLIERHVYLIVPADRHAGHTRQRGRVPLFGRRLAQRQSEMRELARQELTLRTEALTQQFASCGLTCRRLHNDELARLFYRSLTPERALAHPLPAQLLSAVGQPPRLQRRSSKALHQEPMPLAGSEHQWGAPSGALGNAQRPLPTPDLLHLVDLLAPECIEVTPDTLRIGQEYACGLAVTACPREVSFDGWLAPLALHDDVFDLTFHYHPLDAASHPTTFEQVEALQSCLPQARDALLRTTTLDSTTLATMLPFLSNSLIMPDGILIGISETHEPVLLNPWDGSLENPHLFIGGVTGSGKSYLGKLLVERDLLLNWQRGDQCFVIDPDLEYHQLAEALGGTVVRLAPGSAQRLNPFDLLPPRCDFRTYLAEASKGDRLAEKIQDLHAMLDIILAEDVSTSSSGGGMLTKREKGLLDRALYETYRRVGISGDPRTHHRQPPLLHQLYELLKSGLCGPDETDLSGRLYRYVSGSLSSLFSDVTSVDLTSSLVVWDIRDMRSELRPLAISLIADRVWTQALYDSRRPRALYIDEAASLIEHPAGGHFLATLSRRARKRYLRLVTITQNPEQFVQDPWGSVVASNAAIKVLKTQDATSAAAVAERFHLTRSEQQRLITFGSHEALVLAGGKRVIITILASQREHALITTNPVERAQQSSAGQAEPDAQVAVESRRLALSRQKTIPLPRLEVQEGAAGTNDNGTVKQEQQA